MKPYSLLVLALLSSACGDDDRSPGEREAGSDPRDAAQGLDARVADAAAPGSDARVVDAYVARDASQNDAATQPDAGSAPTRSVGCGKAATGSGSFQDRTIEIAGQQRKYALWIPNDYDRERAYPLIFRFHGSSGNGRSGGLDIEKAIDGGALIVSPDGLNKSWSGQTETADLALFDTLLAEVSATYCVDPQRVFSFGFSAGAGFSELLACKRAKVLRGVGMVAGFDRAKAGCTGPIAAWLTNDADDPSVGIARGRAARDVLRAQNGCSEQSDTEDGCQRYRDCRAGYPVVWCESSGLGHNIRADYAPARIWSFFESLP